MEWGRVRLPWTEEEEEEEGGDSPPKVISRCRGDGRRTGTGECVGEPWKSAAGAEGWRLFDSCTSREWNTEIQWNRYIVVTLRGPLIASTCMYIGTHSYVGTYNTLLVCTLGPIIHC